MTDHEPGEHIAASVNAPGESALTNPTKPATTEPTWYQKAESAYQAQLLERQADTYLRLRRQADQVNARLAELGITPVRPANVVRGLALQPALLLEADDEREPTEVFATWDDDSGSVAVAVQDYGDPWQGGPRISRPLTDLGDIAAARHEGAPAPKPAPQDPRAHALASIRGLNADHLTPDGHAIADQIAALTAAVLHLSDSIIRVHDRP
ncbi:hypothetical protein [Kitasatospora aureofaciens]|uniref:hypothetical protein n=1 Tax=Kitasatospora aureofaciens TaxID=1894 RepID=UPI0005278AC4|nr:hypothetical protein [Kitasatospora aureofaciens]